MKVWGHDIALHTSMTNKYTHNTHTHTHSHTPSLCSLFPSTCPLRGQMKGTVVLVVTYELSILKKVLNYRLRWVAFTQWSTRNAYLCCSPSHCYRPHCFPTHSQAHAGSCSLCSQFWERSQKAPLPADLIAGVFLQFKLDWFNDTSKDFFFNLWFFLFIGIDRRVHVYIAERRYSPQNFYLGLVNNLFAVSFMHWIFQSFIC